MAEVLRPSPGQVLVHSPQGISGGIAREGDYIFTFDPRASASSAPALSMPYRALPYLRPSLHPIFQMNLPEGFVLEQLRNRLAKTTGMDPLLLLSVIGSQSPIGRLRFTLDQGGDSPAIRRDEGAGERLGDLLASRGSKALFARLVDDYLLRTCLSGVQPKVLVPERPAGELPSDGKASMAMPELIVKSGLGAFPGLAINEFVCMSIVRRAGVPVPDFYLSDDGELFVMRRFDRPDDGSIVGFEDMLVLAGRDAADKYKGSYELVLKLLRLYCTPAKLPAAREQLFDMVALSCILGNGDAHMKNFGVIYTSLLGEVEMAPAYDVVCTRLYIPDDNLALDLNSSRSFFAARQGLLEFGAKCDMSRDKVFKRVHDLARLTLTVAEELRDTADRLPGLRPMLETEARLYAQTFARD